MSAAEPPPHWTDRLQRFDRRWIFLLVWILVMIPLVFPLRLPLAVSPPVKQYYEEIEKLQEGDVVLLSADFDPASAPSWSAPWRP